MTHWLCTAFSTYLLHSEHSNGYQWWSGPGSNLAYGSILLGMWHRHNCHQRFCLKIVRHGQTHCKKHRGQDAGH